MSEQDNKQTPDKAQPVARATDNPKPQKPGKSAAGGGRRRGGDRHRGKPPGGEAKPATTPPPAAGAPTTQQDNRHRLPLALAVVAIVLGVGVGVTAYFTWKEVDRISADQTQARGRADTEIDRLQERFAQGDRRVDTLQADLDQKVQAAADRLQRSMDELRSDQQEVQGSVALLRAQMGRSQDGWLLAEVEYLLRVANQRIQLQRDPDTALSALQAADGRLDELGDPGYLGVREALAEEIVALKAVPRVDAAGLVLNLSTLQDQVEGLRVAGARYVPAEERYGDVRENIAASDWKELPGVIWQAVRRLLAIRTHDEPATAMLPPDQEYFLYQNLRLVLEAAHLSLLQGNQEGFRTSLATARGWLKEHFDQDDPATTLMDDSLARLARVEIRPPMPDISASLRLLRQQLALVDSAAVSRLQPLPASGAEAPPVPVESDTAPAAEREAAEPEAMVPDQPAEAAAADTATDPGGDESGPVAAGADVEATVQEAGEAAAAVVNDTPDAAADAAEVVEE